jgi:ribonuclease HI
MNHKVEIYTDGSCLGNPGPGGWAALLRSSSEEKVIFGHAKETTNNRMELTGAIEALQVLTQQAQVKLVTDSQYLRLGMTQWVEAWQSRGWRRADNKPVKNADLWKVLVVLSEKHNISWHWVKAHNGHPDNERVDQLAQEQARKAQELA